MATLMPEGKQSFTNSAGAPLVGGKVYTYDAGTNTPRVTYADAAGTVPNINPVVLDARGEATIFWDGVYKVVLKDAADVTVWTVDGAASGNYAVDVLKTLLASSTGSAQIGFLQAGANAVLRTVQDKEREVLSVRDFGVLPGAEYSITNCAAYVKLIAAVRAIGTNVDIYWPPGEYQFSPKDDPTYSGAAAYAWRNATELVDVTNVYHRMDGVTMYHRADPTWYRGNSLPVAGLDESCLQFRSSVSGGCKHVGVLGHAIIKTDATLADPSLGHSDGTAMGIAYRACQHTLTAYCRFEWWGTDGLYFGSGYGDTFGGENHTVIDPRTYRCYRQGISVVFNSHGTIIGGSLEETQGGSFGHGIDFEPNGSHTQSDWVLVGTRTRNNQRGACNFINTSDVTWLAPDIDEQQASANGSVYVDGSNVVGYTVRNIRFIGGRIFGLQPILYISTNSTPLGGIDAIEFIDNDRGSLSDSAALASGGCVRVNPAGLVGRQIGRIKFKGGSIRGNGGMTIKGDGTTRASITVQDVDWYLTNPNGSTVTFIWGGDTTSDVYLDNVRMTVDPTKTMATTQPFIPRGWIRNCSFSSHAAAVIEWRDWSAGRTVEIGWNEFSAYSYYDGVVTALDLKIPGAVQEKHSGDFGIKYRVMNGGRQRVLNYVATPGVFTDAQAPLDGDMVYDVANSAVSLSSTAYVYDGQLAAWRQCSYIVRKGTTLSRPTPAANLQAAYTGVMYLDITLNANGKPIWWNGTAWVDSTGALV